MLTDIAGVRVGHWTDEVARTGCTVVLPPAGTVGAAEVRGGAPATRELALLAPERLVDRVDAVVLAGGSAFGLAAADGVMRWCEEQGLGFPTGAGPVPIVPTLALFDLMVGDGSVRPGPGEGYAACTAATDGPAALGAVGAGTGATVGTWLGPERTSPGGIGAATVRRGPLTVASLVAVNAFGSIDRHGDASDWAVDPATLADDPEAVDGDGARPQPAFGNTSIGVIATNARLGKAECLRLAQGGHDGLARAIVPAHTRYDGDALVALATGEDDIATEMDVEVIRLLAVVATERAVRSLASA